MTVKDQGKNWLCIWLTNSQLSCVMKVTCGVINTTVVTSPFKGAVAHGRVPSQKIAQLSLNKSLADIFYTNM